LRPKLSGLSASKRVQMKRAAFVASLLLLLFARIAHAQQPQPQKPQVTWGEDSTGQVQVQGGGICEIDPSACPKPGDIKALARRRIYTQPIRPAEDPEKELEVSVRAKPPPRSASDWEVDEETLRSTPKQNGADVIGVVPGVFVTERSALGRAPRLSLRGFEGTSGQDVEIFLGNIPLNQASNIRAPGYADMRLVMPEVIRSMRVSSGPYDPRQGDFAIAGSVRMDPGLSRPGFTSKGTYGSFNTKRVFLAFAPDDHQWRESFAAFEAYGTDGPGGFGRAGDRTSFVGQLAWAGNDMVFHGIAAVGSARFDFPGYLDQRTVEQRGLSPFSSRTPLGRDRTSQAHIGTDFTWSIGHGTLTLGAFASKTKMAIHQNLTGFALDVIASPGVPPTNPDGSEQVNDASTLGLHTAYKRGVTLISKRDLVELGAYSRLDSVDQTDTRLNADGTRNATPVDATISATNLAAYIDAFLYPIRRLVLRGGPRLDSLSYSVKDRASPLGIERTSQGFHLGNKVTADVAVGNGMHAVASYGEGFRSPQARLLAEGDRVPFATVRSVEGGVQQKSPGWRASLVGFGSWLSQDRVFDPSSRENAAAPSSRRLGVATAIAAKTKPLAGRYSAFNGSMSATYTHAVFTGSDVRFRDGDPVPYAPRLVLRTDASLSDRIGRLAERAIVGKIGAGLEGAAERFMPDGSSAKNALFVDALATVTWREFEIGVSGTNLLALRYYDAQYLYASNFERAPVLPAPRSNVLVAVPTMVLFTLDIHIEGRKEAHEQQQERQQNGKDE
jgi:iron complex outermembrane receptor protein